MIPTPKYSSLSAGCCPALASQPSWGESTCPWVHMEGRDWTPTNASPLSPWAPGYPRSLARLSPGGVPSQRHSWLIEPNDLCGHISFSFVSTGGESKSNSWTGSRPGARIWCRAHQTVLDGRTDRWTDGWMDPGMDDRWMKGRTRVGRSHQLGKIFSDGILAEGKTKRRVLQVHLGRSACQPGWKTPKFLGVTGNKPWRN